MLCSYHASRRCWSVVNWGFWSTAVKAVFAASSFRFFTPSHSASALAADALGPVRISMSASANLLDAIYRRQPAVLVLLYALDQRMVIELLLKIRVVQQGQYALFQRLTAGIDYSCNGLVHGRANERHQKVDKADADCDIEIRKRGHKAHS